MEHTKTKYAAFKLEGKKKLCHPTTLKTEWVCKQEQEIIGKQCLAAFQTSKKTKHGEQDNKTPSKNTSTPMQPKNSLTTYREKQSMGSLISRAFLSHIKDAKPKFQGLSTKGFS